jgi:para-nitrobenzyl esterase
MPPKVLCEQRYPGKSLAQKALSKAMVTYWTTFAKTGDPNPAGASAPPVWTRFTTAKRQMMSLDAPTPRVISAATFDGRHRCSSFWDEHLE